MTSCVLLVDRVLNGDDYSIWINSKTIKELKLIQNSYVLVSGRDSKRIVCQVQIYDGKTDKALLNRVNRHNLGIYLNDAVTIQPCKSIPIGVMVKIGLMHCDDNNDLSKEIFKKVLSYYFTKSRRVLHEKNKFIVRGGMKTMEFVVLSVIPNSYGFVDEDLTNVQFTNTVIRYEDNESPLSDISYDDIGGFNGLIQNIRKTVECPLRFPSAFLELKVEVPKVIFHGSEGLGKALVANAIATETGAKFILMNEKNIYGTAKERVSRVKMLFKKAFAFAPSILCIDSLDYFLPHEYTTEESEIVGNTLINLLVQLNKVQDVVILIGIAKDLNNVHPIAREFFKNTNTVDKRFKFKLPDVSGRIQILMIHTRNLNLVNDFSIPDLASMTADFSPAKLAYLCKRVAIKNKVQYDVSTQNRESDESFFLFKQCLTNNDFTATLKDRQFQEKLLYGTM